MSGGNWKDAERRIARLVGGKRVPVSGRARGATPDVAHPWLAIEVKHWKAFPNWLMDAMRQAVAAVRGEQLPAVILHEKGARYHDALIVMRVKDFIDWFGEIEGSDDE